MVISECGSQKAAGLRLLVPGALMLLTCAATAQAHNDHMLIGRSSGNQLRLAPGDGVQDGATIVLDFIPPGGPIEGYSAAIPGFSLVLVSTPPLDIYALSPGADIWLEITRIDTPLLLVETPSYAIVNERIPPESRIGSDAQAHFHPLWLLDTRDPSYASGRCIWEITFILKDKGSTQYANSEPITFRFVAGALPCPADFDCDGDVDAADFDIFQACSTRSGVAYDAQALPPLCSAHADHAGFIRPDIDRDGDVDLADFSRFQRCAAGDGVPPAAGCAE